MWDRIYYFLKAQIFLYPLHKQKYMARERISFRLSRTLTITYQESTASKIFRRDINESDMHSLVSYLKGQNIFPELTRALHYARFDGRDHLLKAGSWLSIGIHSHHEDNSKQREGKRRMDFISNLMVYCRILYDPQILPIDRAEKLGAEAEKYVHHSFFEQQTFPVRIHLPF